MTARNIPGDPPVPVILRRSPRARRISLRVSQLDGRVTLTLPRGVAEAEAMAFAREKEQWIRTHLAARSDDVPVVVGAEIPVEGVPLRLQAGAGRGVRAVPGGLAVPPDAVGRRLQGWLRNLARDRLVTACDGYAGTLGRGYSRITLRDTRSRWGSCSAEGALMFSWRLILAPPEVLRYVAAHEVAHLAEMNHSPAFWAQVARLYGDYDDARGWLRSHGATLHRYKFGE